MSNIIEKLGIPKMDFWIETINYTTYHCVENVNQVRELEQQRNEMLEALVNIIKSMYDNHDTLANLNGHISNAKRMLIDKYPEVKELM